MSEEEDAPTCTWQQIESILSLPTKERTEEEIKSILPWFRERSTLFQTLDNESLSGVVLFSELVRYKGDHVIVHQGDVGDCFYIIVRGSVAVHAKKLEASGKEIVGPVLPDVTVVKGAKERSKFGAELSILRAGRCFGELSVLSSTQTERNATIISDEACLFVSVQRDVYSKFVPKEYGEEIVRRSLFVASHPLFRSWAPAYRNLLAENLQLRHLKFGEKIARQGDSLDAVYFVLSGQASLTLNPIKHRDQYPRIISKVQIPRHNSDESFDPFQNISVVDRRKLRRFQGYYASELRYRELNLCTLGAGGIIGDVEAILDLPLHTVTAECTQEMKLYEMDRANFVKIVLRKNPETFERMQKSVHEKLLYRNQICSGGIPLYTALLENFRVSKPKDNRQKIIRSYMAKHARKKNAKNNFFNRMAGTKPMGSEQEIQSVPHDQTNEVLIREKNKQALWKNTGKFTAKMNIIYQNKKGQPRDDAAHQFTADEYKDLKKKMHALGKCTAKGGGWSN